MCGLALWFRSHLPDRTLQELRRNPSGRLAVLSSRSSGSPWNQGSGNSRTWEENRRTGERENRRTGEHVQSEWQKLQQPYIHIQAFAMTWAALEYQTMETREIAVLRRIIITHKSDILKHNFFTVNCSFHLQIPIHCILALHVPKLFIII